MRARSSPELPRPTSTPTIVRPWTRAHLNDKARREALAVISTAERDRYESTAEAGRDSFLAGRLMLRRLAADLTGSTPEAVALSAAVCPDCGGAHGRPQLADSALHLSLSRTRDVVVAAAVWGAHLGIDVEDLDQPSDALAAIGVLTGETSLLRWTRVEAVLKADGRGLRIDPSLVSIESVGGEVRGSVADRPARYGISEVALTDQLRVSVAVELEPES